MNALTTHHLHPEFPSDLPTAPLESISLHQLESSSTSEGTKLFRACSQLGFFYLNLFGSDLGETIVHEVEELHLLQQEFYALPHEDKDRYGKDKVDPFFSYRWTACAEGTKDVWQRPG